MFMLESMGERACLLCQHVSAYSSGYVRGTSRAGLIIGAVSGEGCDAEPRRFKDYDNV